MLGDIYQRVTPAIVGSFAVPVFQFMYGEGKVVETTMIALVFFIVMDWLSGSRAARKDNTYGSRYGIDGIFRTFFMILLPAGGHFLDLVLNLPGVLFGALVGGLIYHTLKSMTANCIRAGWADWLPISILEYVTDWVKSEIESKIARSQQRMKDKGQGGGVSG